ncbi:pci domain-containing protein [Lentinula edodes]|uniref:Pci domain-containing protein n=1 Tax=Lentinula edodes TaxID=5353 RepID=A0A1Q3E1B2_LENED|nr:pci domain-containing protein [Lentinula edodes]
MSQTDSVSVFAEGTFEEFKNCTEGQKPLSEDVERRRKIFVMILTSITGLGHGQEKEIEGFFNLIYAHLFSLFSPSSQEAKQHTDTLLKVISSAPSEQTTIKYRILSNLFNALPRNSSLRLSVYNTILQIAVADDSINALHLSRSDVEKWTNEWDISPEDKSAFLEGIVDAYAKSNQLTQSYDYSLIYLRSLPSPSEAARDTSIKVIASALRIPSIFDFDALFKIDAVVANKDHELFSLLQVFLNNGLSEFKSWEASHAGVLEKYDLGRAQLERKIRLLTLASLGFKNIGTNLPYAKIAEAIQVDASEVEKWVIDMASSGATSIVLEGRVE